MLKRHYTNMKKPINIYANLVESLDRIMPDDPLNNVTLRVWIDVDHLLRAVISTKLRYQIDYMLEIQIKKDIREKTK